MDGRGGCCIARYAGGGYHTSKMDQIMLRFRPIAPKPPAASGGSGSGSGSSTPENSNNELSVKSGRGKRKYVRYNSKRCNKKRKDSPEAKSAKTEKTEKKRDGVSSESVAAVTTLSLLPETPEQRENPVRSVQNTPIWLNFDNNTVNSERNYNMSCYKLDRTAAEAEAANTVVVPPQAVKIVGSCVTVECVTDTWVDGNGLGCTDMEKVRNLEMDTCPGFISDGLNRVTWMNGAYKSMVGRDGGGGEMMVWLVVREKVPVMYPAFTCRVRLQYTCMKEKSSITLPCDVWRMDGGGFAWRLDVKAALCLGR